MKIQLIKPETNKMQTIFDKTIFVLVLSCVPICWVLLPLALVGLLNRQPVVETRIVTQEPVAAKKDKEPDVAAWNRYKENGDSPEGLRELVKAAESGMPDAALALARMYEEGKHFAKDERLAMRFYGIGAEAGSREAMGAFGRALYRRGDYAAAWPMLATAAERGDAFAAVDCGRMAMNGNYVPKDKALATRYWEQAASLGHQGVIAELARIHRDGDGVPKSPERAAEFLLRGAQGGNLEAMLAYAAWCVEKENSGEAVFWYQRAAEKKSAKAAESLAQIFENGIGVPKDEDKAEEWHRRAMAYGSSEAAYALGKLLRKSAGRDREAYAVFAAAAKDGHARALFHVGDMKERGIGTEKDMAGAIEAYKRSAAGGCRDAEARLARLGKDGVKIPAASSSQAGTKRKTVAGR